MSVTEVLRSAQFIVDAKGNRMAVVLNMAIWEEISTFLEDIEDAEEVRRLREIGEEAIPWEQAKVILRREGKSV